MTRFEQLFTEWGGETPAVADISVENDTELHIDYAVTTSEVGSVVVSPDGLVYTAFGGLGVRREEVDTYVKHAVSVWRSLAGDEETEFEYARRWYDEDTEEPPAMAVDA